MTTFRSLLLALLVVGVVACSSNPTESEEEFEPYKAGNWLVTSPESAEFIGSQSKENYATMASDTVVIEEPGQRYLELVKDTIETEGRDALIFSFSFIDSTVTINDNPDIGSVRFRGTVDASSIGTGSQKFNVGPERFRAELELSYFCGEDIPSNYNLALNLLNEESRMIRRYIIQSRGFEDVMIDFCD